MIVNYIDGCESCSFVELDLVISIQTLISAGEIIELPTVCLIALVFEDSVIAIEKLRGFRPVLNIAATSYSLARVIRRAAEVRTRISAASSSSSTGTTDQILFHIIFGDRPKNLRILVYLLVVVDSCANAHAVTSVRFLELKFLRARVLIECARRRSTIKLTKIWVIDLNKSTRDWAESYIEVISINIAHIIKIWTSAVGKS
jgi:hypothetical protein